MQLILYLPPSDRDTLKKARSIASSKGTSLSRVVRKFVSDYVKKNSKEKK